MHTILGTFDLPEMLFFWIFTFIRTFQSWKPLMFAIIMISHHRETVRLTFRHLNASLVDNAITGRSLLPRPKLWWEKHEKIKHMHAWCTCIFQIPPIHIFISIATRRKITQNFKYSRKILLIIKFDRLRTLSKLCTLHCHYQNFGKLKFHCWMVKLFCFL